MHLHEVDVLAGSPRSHVVRVRTEGGHDLPSTVVVKAHVEATTRAAEIREPAALGLLTAAGSDLAPRLLALADVPPLVVLADLGAGLPSLADALPDFDTDLAVAESGWAMISTAWFLERGVRDSAAQVPHVIDAPDPDRRAVLLRRLSLVATTVDSRLTPLRDLATEIHDAALASWGESTLALAPAFRG